MFVCVCVCVRVRVCVCLSQGQEMAMSLARDNIEATLITDSAVLAMMSRVNKVCVYSGVCVTHTLVCLCIDRLACAVNLPTCTHPGHNWDAHSAGRWRVSEGDVPTVVMVILWWLIFLLPFLHG